MEKIQLSETFPEWPPEKVLLTFINKVIWHDWRGSYPYTETYEGWIFGYYISNKYLWIISIHTKVDGEADIIKIAKFKIVFEDEEMAKIVAYRFPFIYNIGLYDEQQITLQRVGSWKVPPKSELAKFILNYIPKISCEEE
ncbi:MAG: hypothetical protein QXL06_06715 [Nitrososphaerota archaeon]